MLSYADASGAPGKAAADTDIVEARFVEVVPKVRVVQEVDFVSDDRALGGHDDNDLGGHCGRRREPGRLRQTTPRMASPPRTTR